MGSTDESGESRDTSAYAGGSGIALRLENGSPDLFDVTVVIRTPDGQEFARYTAQLAGEQSAEKWWSASTGGYVLDMSYSGRTTTRTGSGDDTRSIEVGGECAELSRGTWRFIVSNGTIGSAWRGKECVSESDVG